MNSKDLPETQNLTRRERRMSMTLASIFALRMLGLFMIMPIFSLYAPHYQGATPFLIGIALGIYGISSGLLQAPWGWLSDKYGRKPIIIIGLLLFALGSVVAALSHSMMLLVIGRFLQGFGAVGSTVLAYLADLTRPEVRTRAMAMVGMTIGSSFVLAMVLGPMLSTVIGLSGIFGLTAILAVIASLTVAYALPTPDKLVQHPDQFLEPVQIGQTLKNRDLLRLNFGIFVLHAILTATFIVLPNILINGAKIDLDHQWMVYLPVLVLAFVFMVPMIIIAEKRRHMKSVLLLAIIGLIIAEIAFSLLHDNRMMIGLTIWLFFTAFTTLEAILPSWVSKVAPVKRKGTALGLYSSSQFLGAFAGGAIGGWLYMGVHYHIVYLFCVILLAVWFWGASRMNPPVYLTTRILSINTDTDVISLERNLLMVAGVAEAVVNKQEAVVYLKVDSKIVDNDVIMSLISGRSD